MLVFRTLGLVEGLGQASCFKSTLGSFRLKLKALYTVSEVLWTLIQEKLDPQTTHN